MNEVVINPATFDWDAPGALSVVLQGGLAQGNLIETAMHCQHWRQVFPNAQIILSISGTDCVGGERAGGIFEALKLVPSLQHNTQFQAVVQVIEAVCDKVALAEPALPLPKIKIDSPGPNHFNLQLAAAQRGLALATGTFTLRVRSDLIFMDRRFIEQFVRACAMPRGSASRLQQRVLISWLYTVNPFMRERMPLHFSDWFHFGLTSDLRKIWDVPPVQVADSMYYRGHPHTPGSNDSERLFLTRLAVEQHLMLECFRADFPGLVLDYHNDLTSRALAMDILVDNFAICDLLAAACVFNKYDPEVQSYELNPHCLTAADWFALAAQRDVPHEVTLADKIDSVRKPVAVELAKPLPRTFPASRMHKEDGRLVNGEVVAFSREGLLFWGPYTALPRGRYNAALTTTSLEGPGTVVLRILINAGRDLLAERIVEVGPGVSPSLEVDFDVSIAQATELEVSCRYEKLSSFAVASVTISERTTTSDAERFQQDMPLHFGATSLSTRDGRHLGDEIVSEGRDGTLFYGPYAKIIPGRYLATIRTSSVVGSGTVVLKAVADGSEVASRSIAVKGGSTPVLDLRFYVPGQHSATLEVRCSVQGLEAISVLGVDVSREQKGPLPPSPRKLFGR